MTFERIGFSFTTFSEYNSLIEQFISLTLFPQYMEYILRIARAQSMDALSSMSTIAGYKAVVMAAEKLAKMFPLLMTAAGTVMQA